MQSDKSVVRLLIIIPAYNEAENIERVVDDLKKIIHSMIM